MFDRDQIQPNPLTREDRLTELESVYIDPDAEPAEPAGEQRDLLAEIAGDIRRARREDRSVIVAYGAHAIKNGCGGILRRLVEGGQVTHLATNGAGTIHDWEFAYLGKTEESVRTNVQTGDFGTWDETDRFINLAVIVGAVEGRGYGESVGKLIHDEGLSIPSAAHLKRLLRDSVDEPAALPAGWSRGGIADFLDIIERYGDRFAIPDGGFLEVKHPHKQFSVQEATFARRVPYTVHPGIGYDIVHTHPICCEAAIGRAAGKDFLTYVQSVSEIEGGVYLSIGSAIMSPMVFEKSLSMARKVALAKGEDIRDFRIVVNDIQPGEWEWGTGREPPKDDPAYYLRFCKTFDRMGADRMNYVCADNRAFLHNLWHMLRQAS